MRYPPSSLLIYNRPTTSLSISLPRIDIIIPSLPPLHTVYEPSYICVLHLIGTGTDTTAYDRSDQSDHWLQVQSLGDVAPLPMQGLLLRLHEVLLCHLHPPLPQSQ